MGRYGFVFSPRWQNEGIEKKKNAHSVIALAPLRLTHAPYIQGILDEERDCNFIPAHMEGGKLAQKDIICLFFLFPGFY